VLAEITPVRRRCDRPGYRSARLHRIAARSKKRRSGDGPLTSPPPRFPRPRGKHFPRRFMGVEISADVRPSLYPCDRAREAPSTDAECPRRRGSTGSITNWPVVPRIPGALSPPPRTGVPGHCRRLQSSAFPSSDQRRRGANSRDRIPALLWAVLARSWCLGIDADAARTSFATKLPRNPQNRAAAWKSSCCRWWSHHYPTSRHPAGLPVVGGQHRRLPGAGSALCRRDFATCPIWWSQSTTAKIAKRHRARTVRWPRPRPLAAVFRPSGCYSLHRAGALTRRPSPAHFPAVRACSPTTTLLSTSSASLGGRRPREGGKGNGDEGLRPSGRRPLRPRLDRPPGKSAPARRPVPIFRRCPAPITCPASTARANHA